MQTVVVRLESEPSSSFRCTKAANALDIDVEKKLTHELNVQMDIATPYKVGLVVGASGSGKTSLAKLLFGRDFDEPVLDLSRPVIDQFPEAWTYEQCAQALTGMGLSAVTCWIRPAGSLSNGQRARAEAALRLAGEGDKPVVIDEWTSVVDRTVAKAMSACIAKHARRQSRPIVLLSCHYDVIEWLEPDWILDCNTGKYLDRRGLRCERAEKLNFGIYPCPRASWKAFSRYHYLSDKMPGGLCEQFGLYHGDDQIGFLAFTNYMPHRKGERMKMHANRLVVHPDYCGFGLGIRFLDACCEHMAKKGYEVRSKLSALPMVRARRNNPNWRLVDKSFATKVLRGGTMQRSGGFRLDVTTYSYKWIGPGA
jgi:ABC-type ATPase with predicted acetyltransferase domain